MNLQPHPPFHFHHLILAVLLFLPLTGCVSTKSGGPVTKEEKKTLFYKNSDTNQDGRVSQAELAKGMHREALAEFDLNNDNYISSDEWAATKLSPGQEDEHFNKLDKDGDGKIGESEALTFITEHVSFTDTFKKLDENSDDHLDMKEYAQAEPASLNITLFSIRQ